MNEPPPAAEPHHPGWAERLREELRNYAIVSAYLYVCLAALLLYKAAVLQDAGVNYVPLGVAVVKALVIGKFVLIGDAIRKAAQRAPRNLLVRIGTRVLWLLVILILLTLAEELVLGLWHGQSVAEAGAAFEGRSTLEMLAEVLLMLLLLVPIVAVAELNQALGPGTLGGLLTRTHQDAPGSTAAGDDAGSARR